jgi:hypothetical protein
VQAKPRVVVRVEIPGAVEIKKGTMNEVVVDADIIEPESVDYSAEQNGDVVTVRGRGRPSVWSPLKWGSYLFSGGPKCELTISVPAEADLNLETVTDEIEVVGVSGRIETESKTGPIRLRQCSGTFRITTQTGAVEVEDAGAIVQARSTTGHVRFRGKLGSGDNSFRATTGSVDISLEDAQDLQVEAATTVGSISCSVAGLSDTRHERGEFVGERFRGSKGTGSTLLRAETTVGSISIHG